jgi:hypothetical protein
MADCGFENPFALQSVRIAHFLEDSWTDGHTVDKRKGAKAQRRSRFGIGIPSLRLCALATLRWKIFLIREIRGSIPSVAAGRAGPYAPFCGKSLQVPAIEQLTIELGCCQSRLIKVN